MTEYPPLTVVMTTWAPGGRDGYTRRQNARHTADTWTRHLMYEGDLYLHIADDGSAMPNYPEDIAPQLGRWREVTFSRQERRGVGASLNAGMRQAFDLRGGQMLYAVDDWMLMQPIDVTPWVRLLEQERGVGVVRLGPPHPWLTGTIEHFAGLVQGDGAWAMRLDRHHFAFGHRPALYHLRMRTAYGDFAEGVNAYDAEIQYNEVVCAPGDAGHGHVRLRRDGVRARCGGPAACHVCLQERELWPDVMLALPHPWRHAEGPEHADVVPEGA